MWRLPLHHDYVEMMKGRYAQLTNRSWRREAFPVTAAEFLGLKTLPPRGSAGGAAKGHYRYAIPTASTTVPRAAPP